METVKDIIAQIRTRKGGTELVRDWKSMIPADSKWQPNDPGNPACKLGCEGTGYVRLDLPLGHPKFGHVFLCECVDQVKYAAPAPVVEEKGKWYDR